MDNKQSCIIDKNDEPSEWASTKRLCSLLGLSRTTLTKLKSERIFEPGKHFYRTGMGRRAPLMWKVEACRGCLQRLTASDPADFETFAFANK